MSAHTRIDKPFEILEDDVDLRSLLRVLVSTLFGDLPDRRGHPWGFETARLLWAFALRDQSGDMGVREFGEGHLSGHKLGTKVIRTWTNHAFGKQTHLHDDHRQGVHIDLIRQFPLPGPYGGEKLGGAVTDRATEVGGRGVDRVDVLGD